MHTILKNIQNNTIINVIIDTIIKIRQITFKIFIHHKRKQNNVNKNQKHNRNNTHN